MRLPTVISQIKTSSLVRHFQTEGVGKLVSGLSCRQAKENSLVAAWFFFSVSRLADPVDGGLDAVIRYANLLWFCLLGLALDIAAIPKQSEGVSGRPMGFNGVLLHRMHSLL